MHRWQWIALATLLVLCSTQLGWTGPLDFFRPRVEADPNKSYWLTEDQGPWMIMAASFSGEGAEGQAHDLVIELRKTYGLEAYMFRRTFDFSGKVRANGITSDGSAKYGVYRRGGTREEIAVMVGNFADVEDPKSQRTLDTLKSIRHGDLQCLRLDRNGKDYRSLALLRVLQTHVNQNAGNQHTENAKRGPLSYSFVTTNPLLPDTYFNPRGLDPTVVSWNEPVEFSLLKCKSKYTVKVATFTGAVIVDPKKIKKIEATGGATSRLAKGAIKAHQLTEELRRMGYEAFEFHDRYSSIVTIGSFNELGPQINGQIQLDQRIVKLIEVFGAYRDANNPNGAQVGEPKKLLGIPFDIQPQIVEVPRPSISAAYRRSLWN